MPDEIHRLALNKFFSGTLISQIKGECGHVSPRTEPFVDLQMIVKNKVTLLDSLEEFVQGEPMEGTNKYKCLSCDPTDGNGRLVNAMRRSCPEKLPDNLTFCLKRFSFESMFGTESKVNDRFEFPQAIDMSRWHRAHLDDPKASIDEDLFELVGVIVHQGSLQFGHYWSYTLLRNTNLPDSRTWMKLEDRMVSLCKGGIEEVQQECFGGLRNNGNERVDNAYVLFYQRKACLEEQISLPGPVQDPATLSLLPPKVAIPPELKGMINGENRWRSRIANLFDNGFHKHIQWLLSSYNHFSSAFKLQSKRDSPVGEDGLPSDPDQAVDKLAEQLSEVATTYLKRVAACESAAVYKLDQFVATLKPILAAEPRVSGLVLAQIAQDHDWISGVVSYSPFKIRDRVLDFILFCLADVREQDQIFYRNAFTQIKHAHAIVKERLDPINVNFRSYLSFAVRLAELGSWEMASVLDGGYLTWVFTVLYTPVNQHPKFPDLLDHLRKNPAKVTALYEFLTAIFSADLALPISGDQSYSPHQVTADGVVLKMSDVDLLALTARQQEAIWMFCAKFAEWNQ